jgi:hypothetical protein
MVSQDGRLLGSGARLTHVYSAHYRAAFTHPEFQAGLAAYPSSVVATPHLFQKVAVPGICEAWCKGKPVGSLRLRQLAQVLPLTKMRRMK